MKKIIPLILILTSAVFAEDGAADALASLVLGFISLIFMFIGGAYLLASIIAVIGAISEAIAKLWEKCNSFGRIVLFGIPLFAIVTTAFYFLIYFALVPAASFYISHCNLAEYKLWIQLGVISVLYLSLIPLGWKTGTDEFISDKRVGVICWLARMIVLLPFASLIIIGKFLFESFTTAFIAKHKFKMDLECFKIVPDPYKIDKFIKVAKNKDHNGQIIPMIDKVLG